MPGLRLLSDLEIEIDVDALVATIENTPLDELLASFKQYMADLAPKLGWSLLVLLVGYVAVRLLTRLVRNILKRSRVDPSLHTFILAALRIVLYTLVVITALGVLGIPLTPLITALSAISLAVSLAVKDSLSNIAGGISIIFARPFGKGDYVDIGSTSGTVREMGLVYTQLRTVDNKHIYLPNGDVAKATVINYSREDKRRLDLSFQLRAGTDVETARKIIVDAVRGCPLALDTPAPIIRVVDQSYALVKFCCNVWVKKESMADLKDYLISTIRGRLNQAGLEGPSATVSQDKKKEREESPRSD